MRGAGIGNVLAAEVHSRGHIMSHHTTLSQQLSKITGSTGRHGFTWVQALSTLR